MADNDVHANDDYEKLKRRHLDVVKPESAEIREGEPHTLEGEGTEPPTGAEPPHILRDRIVMALRTVYDPEIPLNIYDLGLIYGIDVSEDAKVVVRMTLTAPACPVAGALVQEVHDKVRGTVGVRHAKTELVWDPPWTQERLSVEAQLELGLL
jgi:FeS assembly SUF system protein